jgi:selenocysteine lyase/cysteine desulfurase
MTALGVVATARISLAFYNTPAEVDRCVKAIVKAKRLFNV